MTTNTNVAMITVLFFSFRKAPPRAARQPSFIQPEAFLSVASLLSRGLDTLNVTHRGLDLIREIYWTATSAPCFTRSEGGIKNFTHLGPSSSHNVLPKSKGVALIPSVINTDCVFRTSTQPARVKTAAQRNDPIRLWLRRRRFLEELSVFLAPLLD